MILNKKPDNQKKSAFIQAFDDNKQLIVAKLKLESNTRTNFNKKL